MIFDEITEEKESKIVEQTMDNNYTEPIVTFICNGCKRSLSMEHLDREHNLCSKCAAEKKFKLYNNLSKEEKNLNGFLKLEQFIFILVALFFIVKRLFDNYVADYMKENVFFEYPFFWGALAIVGMTLCYTLLSSRKRKMIEIDDEIWSFVTAPLS